MDLHHLPILGIAFGNLYNVNERLQVQSLSGSENSCQEK
jgi:hypothetical protein